MTVLWTARTSNQPILKEINPEYSLEGLMLKLKFQYFGHLMQIANSLEKILMLGKIEGKRRRGQQRIRCLDRITDSMDMNLSKLWETVEEKAGPPSPPTLGVWDAFFGFHCCVTKHPKASGVKLAWTARKSNQSMLKEINSESGRTDAEAKAPILWPLDAKSQLTGKTADAGKD